MLDKESIEGIIDSVLLQVITNSQYYIDLKAAILEGIEARMEEKE